MSTPIFEVFFDGDCPLCVREIRMIRALDRRGRLRFTDIAEPSFDPAREGLPDWSTLMDRIHGRRLPSGEVVEGVEVFRELYGAVGFGLVVKLSRVRPLARLLDRAYHAFASRRLRFTGRCDATSCTIPRRTLASRPPVEAMAR